MKLIDKEKRILYLITGSPPPFWFDYKIGIVDALFMDLNKFKQEMKRRNKLFKQHFKEYKIQRKKELKELEQLLKEN